MAIRSGFYDSVGGDRVYSSEDFNHLFDGVITREGVAPADPPVKLTSSGRHSVIVSEISGRVGGKWFTIDAEGVSVGVDEGWVVDIYVENDQRNRNVKIKTVRNRLPHSTPPNKLENCLLIARVPRPSGTGVDASLANLYPGTDLSPYMAYSGVPPSYNQIKSEISKNRTDFNTVIVEGKPPTYTQLKAIISGNRADFNTLVDHPPQTPVTYEQIKNLLHTHRSDFNATVVVPYTLTYLAVKGVLASNKSDFNSTIVDAKPLTYQAVKDVLVKNKADFNSSVVETQGGGQSEVTYEKVKELLSSNRADFNKLVDHPEGGGAPLSYQAVKELLEANKSDFNDTLVTKKRIEIADVDPLIRSYYNYFRASSISETAISPTTATPRYNSLVDHEKTKREILASEDLFRTRGSTTLRGSTQVLRLQETLKNGSFRKLAIGTELVGKNSSYTVLDWNCKNYTGLNQVILWVGGKSTPGYVPEALEAPLTNAATAMTNGPIKEKIDAFTAKVVSDLLDFKLSPYVVRSDVLYNGENNWVEGSMTLIPGFAMNFFGPNYMVDPPYLTNYGAIYKHFRYFQMTPLDWSPVPLVTQQMSRGAYTGVSTTGCPTLIWRGENEERSIRARPLLYVIAHAGN